LRTNAQRIVDFALKQRIPLLTDLREAVEAGGLMFYAADAVDQYRRAASYVDKILKGTKPADVPVPRSMNFQLLLNLKTATPLGLTFPAAILLQATEVIQ